MNTVTERINFFLGDINDISEQKKDDLTPYQEFFKEMLEEWGVSSPDELSDKDKKKFFDAVDKKWRAKKERKNEQSYSSSREELMDIYDPEEVADMFMEGYPEMSKVNRAKFDKALKKVAKGYSPPKNWGVSEKKKFRRVIENLEEEDALDLLDLMDNLL